MKPFPLFVCMVVAVIIDSPLVLGFDVSFAVSDVCVEESIGSATVSVVRATTGEGASAVGFVTVKGSARASRDFCSITDQVEFAIGQTIGQIVIPLIPDTVPEPSKEFSIVLNAFSNCVPGELTNCNVVIKDSQAIEASSQDFESGLPIGWCVTTNADSDGYWRFDNPGERINLTGGKGTMAVVDSDAGHCAIDSELKTAPFPVATTGLTYLVFKTHYVYCTYDIADVDLSIAGVDGPWTNLWRKHLADYPGPVTELIDLTPVAKGVTNAVVRFHYYNADYDYYWEVDDVAILVEPDSNTNSLPDWWETMYYGGLTNLDPAADSDGDGACNEAEFVAGSNPRVMGSCFRIEGLVRSNDAVSVKFPAALGHFYDLESCTRLMNGSWTSRISRIQGMDGDTNLSLSAPGSNGYYRLNVRRW